jgi:hypothetical protein
VPTDFACHVGSFVASAKMSKNAKNVNYRSHFLIQRASVNANMGTFLISRNKHVNLVAQLIQIVVNVIPIANVLSVYLAFLWKMELASHALDSVANVIAQHNAPSVDLKTHS